uniref:EGF-like domain-containing protein n=1 Tax=Ciona savignyi TaxID=51511 RepID=H2YPK2_CIOSA
MLYNTLYTNMAANQSLAFFDLSTLRVYVEPPEIPAETTASPQTTEVIETTSLETSTIETTSRATIIDVTYEAVVYVQLNNRDILNDTSRNITQEVLVAMDKAFSELNNTYEISDADYEVSPDEDDPDKKSLLRVSFKVHIRSVPFYNDTAGEVPGYEVVNDEVQNTFRNVPETISLSSGNIKPDRTFIGPFNPCLDDLRQYCHSKAYCIGNMTTGTYTCVCKTGFVDANPNLPGRNCTTPAQGNVMVLILIILAAVMLAVIIALAYMVYRKVTAQASFSPSAAPHNSV